MADILAAARAAIADPQVSERELLIARGVIGMMDDATKWVALVVHARDEARANARILAHAYTHDSSPPDRVVQTSIAYPVIRDV